MSTTDIIKAVLWSDGFVTMEQANYEEIRQHCIESLIASAISRLITENDLKEELKKRFLQQIVYNTQCNYSQSHLPITVPYVVLKGTTAAQYYPYPEYRALGDIDIITRREDFDKAYQELKDNGYEIEKKLEREVGFVKNGITVELHRFFASLNKPMQAKYLDDLIIQHINPTHILPDDINGLVLLEHINQHLEKGLGLRQIIDWMMFVDKCLPDDKWPSFKKYADAIGLENLAIVTTRMCEIYLGLPQRKWCDGADEKLCKQLLDYVMACGNFGNTRSDNIGVGDNILYYSSTLGSFFRLLQKRGLENWEAAKKCTILKPFAWMYQAFRYLTRGISREDASSEFIKDYKSAKQRIKMFEALGVRQSTKGLAVYKDGKYKKRKSIL